MRLLQFGFGHVGDGFAQLGGRIFHVTDHDALIVAFGRGRLTRLFSGLLIAVGLVDRLADRRPAIGAELLLVDD